MLRVQFIAVVGLVCIAVSSSFADELVNGDFEDGLTGWTVEGDVTVETTPGNDAAVFRENPNAGVSRIHQVFNLPISAATLSFRFVLDWWVDPGRGGEPADSFSAFLLDPVTLERLLPPPGEPPVGFEDFFFIDNRGLIEFNPDYVTVSDPDEFGVRTVTLDVSSLLGSTEVRIEFGLAGFADGRTTVVMMDDVQTTTSNQPPQAHCRDAELAAGPSCTGVVRVEDVDNGSFDPGGPGDIASLCITALDGVPVGCVAELDLPQLGQYDVTLTITDRTGLSDSCTARVTLRDTSPPVITCPELVVREIGSPAGVPIGEVNLTATAQDNCDGPVEVSDDRPAEHYPLGTTLVTFTARDAAGNVGTCTTSVTVTDTVCPVLVCPAPIAVDTCSPDGIPVDQVALQVTAGDDGGQVVLTDDRPADRFPVGTTTVTFTGTDQAGNLATCTVNVTVGDLTPPVLTLSQQVFIDTCSPDGVAADELTVEIGVTDNCDNQITITDDRPADGFPVGKTTVTFTAVDSSGNVAVYTTEVVVGDFTPPVIECPPDFSVMAEAYSVDQALAEVTATDACGGEVVIMDDRPSDFLPTGTSTVITFTAIDVNGNEATCTALVEVTDPQAGQTPPDRKQEVLVTTRTRQSALCGPFGGLPLALSILGLLALKHRRR